MIYEKALGKIFGRIFVFIFLLTVFLTAVESASVEVSAMHNEFLMGYRIWQLLLLSVPAVVYIVHRGYDAVIDTVLIGIFFISTSGVILYLLTKNYKDYSQLLPILEHGLNIDFFIGVIKLIGAYSSIAILFPLLKDVRDIKNITKYSIIGLLFITQIHLVSMSGNLATFEVEILNSMYYPKLVQTQLIRQSNFLDAGPLFVMLQIVGGWVIKLTMSLYVITKILERFKAKKPIYLAGIGVLIYISAYFACRNLFYLFKLLDIFIYIELINFVIVPLIIFTVFLMRKTTKCQS